MTAYLDCSTFMRDLFVFVADGESVLVGSRIRILMAKNNLS